MEIRPVLLEIEPSGRGCKSRMLTMVIVSGWSLALGLALLSGCATGGSPGRSAARSGGVSSADRLPADGWLRQGFAEPEQGRGLEGRSVAYGADPAARGRIFGGGGEAGDEMLEELEGLDLDEDDLSFEDDFVLDDDDFMLDEDEEIVTEEIPLDDVPAPPATSQRSQAPSHALAQQTSSTQRPPAHSASRSHAEPSARRGAQRRVIGSQ